MFSKSVLVILGSLLFLSCTEKKIVTNNDCDKVKKTASASLLIIRIKEDGFIREVTSDSSHLYLRHAGTAYLYGSWGSSLSYAHPENYEGIQAESSYDYIHFTNFYWLDGRNFHYTGIDNPWD